MDRHDENIDYKQLYFHLFSAIADVIEESENYLRAIDIKTRLIEVLRDAEEEFIISP